MDVKINNNNLIEEFIEERISITEYVKALFDQLDKNKY